jgi:hypothetical protein
VKKFDKRTSPNRSLGMRKRRYMKYTIELEDRELQYILDCIAEKPFKVVKGLMDKLTSQISSQQDDSIKNLELGINNEEK